MIKNISKELDIECKILSKDWVIMLKKEDKIRFISGYKFDLNSHALGQIIDDKYAMYEVLKANNINVINHHIVYSPQNKNEYAKSYNSFEYLKDLYSKYNNDIVLKINNGTCGINVEHITNLEDLNKLYLKMVNKNNSLSLCPYYDIESEFRVIVLKGKIKLIYKKERPIVIGDGKSTIKELLIKFNPSYFNEIDDENLDKVLSSDETYIYDWKFNLSHGAKVNESIVSTDLNEIISLATKTFKSLDIGFASIDIIKTNNQFYVLEINSGVMMKNYTKQIEDGYNKSYQIYKDAVVELFKDE